MRYEWESEGDFYRRLAKRYLRNLWFAPMFLALPWAFSRFVGEKSMEAAFGDAWVVFTGVTILMAAFSVSNTINRYREHMRRAEWYDDKENQPNG